MRYLLTIMIISLLSCKKDSVDNNTNKPLPVITNLTVSSEVIGGKARPKFTITLDIPDAANVRQMEVYQNVQFPTTRSGVIVNPTSGQYTVIDSAATYPASATIKYFAFFTLKDYNFAGYYAFDVK